MAQNAVCDMCHIPYWANLLAQKKKIVTLSHSLLGQLYGPNRDQKLLKNSNTVKKLLKTVKIEFVTVSHSLWGQLVGPKRRL